jgi:hypothetical protein
MSTTIDKLKAVIAQKQGEAADRYLALVADAATGKDVSPEAALRILAAVDKTAEDFAAAVERKAERNRLAALAATRGARESALIAARDRHAAKDAEFSAVRAKQDAELSTLADAVRAAVDAMGEADAAAATLRRDPPPAVAAKLAELDAEARAASSPDDLREMGLRYAKEADELEDMARGSRSPELRAKWNAEAARCRATAIERSKQAADARRRQDERARERERVEALADAA